MRHTELAEWLRDMGRHPMLTPEEVTTIALQMKNATTEPDRRHWRDKLVRGNFRLVVALVKKYQSKVEWLDLIQSGNIGLMTAADKFEPEKGYQFSTYAYWWIRQSIQREIAVARSIRVPFHWQEKRIGIKKAVKTLIQALGRSPSIPEIAKHMDEEISWVEEVLLHGRPIASLNFQFKGEGEELLSLVADADGTPACEIVDRSIMRDRLYSVIDSLFESDKITDEELNVLVRFYGLHGAPIENLSQQSLGNGKERARLQKLKNRVIAQLRTPPVRRQLAHLI